MGLVTTYWPLRMTGAVVTLLQVPDWVKSAVDCRLNPSWFVGHASTRLLFTALRAQLMDGDGGAMVLYVGVGVRYKVPHVGSLI